MALGNTNANEFLNDSFKEQYLFKLIPDLGVFDVAEKYFIDNNSSGIDNLYFYSNISNPSISGISFRRFICKSDSNITVTPSNDEIAKYNFVTPAGNFTIVIDEQFISNGFTVSSNGNYLIGVCF